MTNSSIKFRISNQELVYEYHPYYDDTYMVKSWIDGVEQPTKFISSREAQMTYDYCSSMWVDYDVVEL